MNPETDTDAAIAAMFAGAVPDDGFSARVMARLPQRRTPWRRMALMAAALAGTVPAFVLPAPAAAQAGPALSAAALALAAVVAVAWIVSETRAPPRFHS